MTEYEKIVIDEVTSIFDQIIKIHHHLKQEEAKLPQPIKWIIPIPPQVALDYWKNHLAWQHLKGRRYHLVVSRMNGRTLTKKYELEALRLIKMYRRCQPNIAIYDDCVE